MHWPAVGEGIGKGKGLLGIFGAEKGERGHTSLSPASTLCASVSLSLSSWALLKTTLQAGTIPAFSLSRGNPPTQVVHRGLQYFVSDFSAHPHPLVAAFPSNASGV